MFRNDYSETCAKQVLEKLASISSEQNVGYGLDVHSQNAEKLILKRFGLENEAKVHFLAGGTQANAVVISYFLRPYESVIACDTGHINVHETGAVEGSGHKIFTCPNVNGKLTAQAVEKAVLLHTDEHMAKPKMVYVSDTTEMGTVYTESELTALRQVCDKYGLLLFIDGARLGVALTAGEVTAEFIGKVGDVFYVGGTKNGALFGEAVVVKNRLGADDFRYHIKNRCAMLAKGFVLGAMFEALFENDLYFALAKNTNQTATYIREELAKYGAKFVGGSNTNQIFIEEEKDFAEKLIERYGLELWSKGDKLTLRIVTSFATTEEDCKEFIEYYKNNK